jgi:hypothetical protein
MTTLSSQYAVLFFREVIEDDIEDVHDAAGIGGIVITSLASIKQGEASRLLNQLVTTEGHKRMAVVAFARSGDHDRLYKLYARFGFVEGCVPSLRVRTAN